VKNLLMRLEEKSYILLGCKITFGTALWVLLHFSVYNDFKMKANRQAR
jgi:hypothetical protein